jgi:hypothetical protein
MKNVFIILFLVLLFASCSQKGKTTSNMVVSIGSIATDNLSNYITGGAMLYGKNKTTGDKFGINLIDVDGPLELELENGIWEFSGLLWEGASKFAGVSYCASLTSELSGGEVVLPLDFTNGTCDLFAENMSGSAGTKVFPILEILGCRNLDSISVDTDSCNETLGNEGIPQSYSVSIKTFNSGGNFPVGGSLDECFSISAGKDSMTTMSLPHARADFPFRVEIKSFYSTACDNSRGHHSKVYDQGFVIESTDDHKTFATAGNFTKLYHKVTSEDVCSTSTVDYLTAFSSGDGTAASPYGICFPEQWDIIGVGSTGNGDLSQSYELLTDIDFIGRMTDIPGAVNVPDSINCLDISSNFRPVGDVLATTGTVSCDTENDGLTSAFTGSFNGNKHTIFNPVLNSESQRVGLFRNVDGGTIKNVIIKNANIEGGERTAIIAGHAQNGVRFQDIYIHDSIVEGEGYTGSIVGQVEQNSSTGVMNNLFIFGGTVKGEGDYIGGIAGYYSNSILNTITGNYYSGSVEASDTSSGSNSVGGLYGKVYGVVNFDNIVSKGAVLADSLKIGGMFGTLSPVAASNITINNFRSEMAVAKKMKYYTTGALYVGGIFGYLTNNISLNNGYFSGSIYHGCPPGAVCSDVGEIGGVPSITTKTEVFANELKSYGANLTGEVSGNNKTDDQLRALTASDITSAGWIFSATSKRYPIFLWENDIILDCGDSANHALPATQIGIGKGSSADNPVLICNPEQFAAIGTEDKYYKLGDNINMLDLMIGNLNAGKIDILNGVLDGDGYLIHGLQPGNLSAGSAGYVKENFGEIKDINIVGTHINIDSGNASSISGFVAINRSSGVIKNVRSFGTTIENNVAMSPNKVAAIVAENEGYIENVSSGSVYIDLKVNADNIGGIVGLNSGGTLKNVRTDAYIELSNAAGAMSNIGGVVGEANGASVIDQINFEGNLSIDPTVTTIEKCGGIIGNLDEGSLTNSVNESHEQINTGFCDKFGGLAGKLGTLGSIDRSYSSAEVTFNYCIGAGDTKQNCAGTWNTTAESNDIGPIVGLSTGTITNTYFLTDAQSKIAIISTDAVASCSGNFATVTFSNDPLSGATADLDDRVFFGDIGHTQTFSVTGSGTSYVIDLSGSSLDCTVSPLDSAGASITFTRTEGSNGIGVNKTNDEMSDMSTFCSTSGSTDPYNACTGANDWDIAKFDVGTESGSARIIDYHIDYLTGGLNDAKLPLLGAPSSNRYPIWEINDGYPRLIQQ